MVSRPFFKPSQALWKEWGVDHADIASAPVSRLQSSHPAPSVPVEVAPPPSAPLPLLDAKADARTLLDQVHSLEDLKKQVEAFEGCLLKKSATNTVFCDGNPHAPIMVVGEAPGADEDRLGKPFVGLSGQLLDKMFGTLGWTRHTHLYISNMIFWRPPGNRDPSPQELALCLPFTEKHIALMKPKVLITVGGVASKTLLKSQDGIMKLRGKWHSYQNPYLKDPIPATALYHPAYLLRSPGQKRYAWLDLLKIQEYSQQHGIFNG